MNSVDRPPGAAWTYQVRLETRVEELSVSELPAFAVAAAIGATAQAAGRHCAVAVSTIESKSASLPVNSAESVMRQAALPESQCRDG